MQVPAEDLDGYRKPVRIRLERWLVLRLFLAASVVGWGFVFREFHYLQDRVPIREDGIGYMVRSTDLEYWWVPVLGVIAGLLLLAPRALLTTPLGKIVSAVMVACLVTAGGVLILWAAPIQAYREATLFDQASAANVALTAYVFVLPGGVALASAAAASASADLFSRCRAKAVVAWSVVPVVAAIPAGVGITQWINGVGLGTTLGYMVLAAATVIPLVLLVGCWGNPVFRNVQLVIGGLLLAGSVVVILLGLVLGVVCLFASSPLDDYVCPAALAALALGQGAFLYGWVLNTRGVDSRDARSLPHPRLGQPPI